MSDKVTTIAELKSIKKALEHYPAGAFIEDIEQQIELKISRRTLQRRLLALQNALIIALDFTVLGAIA